MKIGKNVFCGIDASSSCTGISIFANRKLKYYTAIRPGGKGWRDRLANEGTELDCILKKYKPCHIFMEDVPMSATGGYRTAIILGAVQGFIFGIASNNHIPITFVSPNTWRANAGLFDGTKDGRKREVLKQKAINMANERFGLSLQWNGAHSKHSDDDIAEAILICATMIGAVGNDSGKTHSNGKGVKNGN